ncbi:MAG: Tol-Pal system beta propeller repeat protein TolB [Gammaproteobacteria bacterium]|nr:Tol-Pal system beta propeller repeat protein TolB [Gammaproteobacteria bacterium]MDH3406012.1 Tol-Pal system beta propeller repeat protein TolB [Gammaproteobacteria bacterium]MDH3561903.1 Tol-Pal system beta propeller repeat protein TolB [Gammaproteobacteria bacterium]MDH5486367.1 Tol-Pal system beta propeller repeat protein TolB [Gammaproteobacteria bacterium]
MRRFDAKKFILLLTLLWPTFAHAILTIEITRGVDVGTPIAIVPFGWEGPVQLPQNISDVIEADLARSGRFAVLPRRDFVSLPHEDKDVVFKDWRILKAEALVIGSVRQVAPGKYQVQFRLYDVFKGSQITGFRYTIGSEMLRSVAHQISDIIYEKITGEPGAFNTRIAYVTKEEPPGVKPIYKLQVADSDGVNPQTVVRSPEPLLSPAWSPEGNRLAYVSFEDKRSKIYIQNLIDGRRDLVAEYTGINGAPAWSPDGGSLAMALSRDGNAEIYTMHLGSRSLRRMTYDQAIDTEPAWSPDGRDIVFTSDRAGTPQIYRMSASGGPAERLTFDGDYNARAAYAADGKSISLVSRNQGGFRIAVLRLDNRTMQVLTETVLDESPSFAPNGRMIIYATEVRGRGVLASVSADGRVRQLFKLEEGDVREPAWSPYNRELQYKE